MESKPFSKYFAELTGTLILVLMGCGSAVISGTQVGYLGISFAFGIAVLIMVYTIGPISGCHINPAVTIAMLIRKQISVKDSIGYIIAQCIGAVLGTLLLWLIAMGQEGYDLAANGLGQNGYGTGSPGNYNLLSGALAEVVLTFIFITVIIGSTSKKAPAGFAGIAIGLALFLIHIVGIPITGTSVNPARSLGPALFVGGEALSQLWLFIVAPIVGAIAASIKWDWFLGKEETE